MSDNNQSVVTMYTVIGDFGRVRKSLMTAFSNTTKKVEELQPDEAVSESFAIYLPGDAKVETHVHYKQEYIRQQIPGMHNFFARAQCRNQKLHQSVLAQIRAFNCVCGITFAVDDDEQFHYIISILMTVAKDLNAILLTPDMRILNSDGMLIFSADGKSDFSDYTPIANADYRDSKAEMSPADERRRKRNIVVLEQKGIPYITHLPLAAMEAEAVIRSPREIAERLIAMFAVCVYCEGRTGGESWEKSQRYLTTGDNILGGRLDELLTPKEKALIQIHEPEQSQLVQFSWRYECCHVLMWALGVIDELGYPDNVCDVSSMAKYLSQQESLEKFIEVVKPRDASEILDAADLILRYDWACVDARINNRPMPAGLDGGVVYEWHYAFNWLVGYMGADWDNVSTDT